MLSKQQRASSVPTNVAVQLRSVSAQRLDEKDVISIEIRAQKSGFERKKIGIRMRGP
jgi:hypothetical protein